MSLVENYISKLKTYSLVLEDEESKQSFLNYCIDTRTASFFLGKPCKDFKFAMNDQDFREKLLLTQKKALQNQASLKSFLKLVNANNIDVCLLKGSYMANFAYPNFTMRTMRDIDVLVEEASFFRIINLMLTSGYSFLNSKIDKLKKFNFSYSHQAPILMDKFGTAFEIHHRLKRYPEVKNSDHLAEKLMQSRREKKIFDLKVSVPSVNFAFIHCCYHAIRKGKLNIGPIFLCDLLQFKNIIDDKVLEDARKVNCLKEVELGLNLLRYLQDFEVSNEKQVKEAIEILIYCHNMPEYVARKRFKLSSAKDSYAYNSLTFSKNTFLKLKLKQIFMFCKSYSTKFNLHQKRSRFFKDFSEEF
tara:strand:- start:8511 stop:9587 length:1077 start_codon:yes stop_codon:yes gene_type:complete